MLALAMLSTIGVCAFAQSGEELFTSNPNLGVPTSTKDHVYVYKSPYSESVYAGDSAMFIAKAANDTDISWFIKTPSGTIMAIDDIIAQYPAVTVSYNSTKEEVTLKNVPLELDGAQVQARFEGPEGPVYTNTANLLVSEKPAYDPYLEWWYWHWYYANYPASSN